MSIHLPRLAVFLFAWTFNYSMDMPPEKQIALQECTADCNMSINETIHRSEGVVNNKLPVINSDNFNHIWLR